ncbi:MAG: lysoplasmalogenase [Clostridia bacterium]|nr:lysoplasmalogenase [Clostridia bacterium]
MSFMYLAYIGLLIQIIFIYVEQQKKYVPAVALKGTASLFFVLLGLFGLSLSPLPGFAKVVVAGLLFGLIGDVCLNLRFVLENAGQKIFLGGILAFLIGHILYLVALIPLCEKVWVWLIVGVAVAAALLYWILTSVEAEKAFKIFGVVYIGAVVLMTAVAVGVFRTRGTQGSLLYMVGAVLFTLSDVILIFNTFTKDGKAWMRPANLLLYYLGQLFIALSIQVI